MFFTFIIIALSGLNNYSKFNIFNNLNLESNVKMNSNNNYSFNNKKYLDLRNEYIKKFENKNFLNIDKKKVLILGNSYGEDLFISLKQK